MACGRCRDDDDAFMETGGPDCMLEFPHGCTCSAHPVACPAGIAVAAAPGYTVDETA